MKPRGWTMRDLLMVPTPSPWGLYFQTISDRAASIYTQVLRCGKNHVMWRDFERFGPNKTTRTFSFKHEIVMTLQGTITCPTEREKEHHRLKSDFGGDMLVPRRVPNSARFRSFRFWRVLTKRSCGETIDCGMFSSLRDAYFMVLQFFVYRIHVWHINLITLGWCSW